MSATATATARPSRASKLAALAAIRSICMEENEQEQQEKLKKLEAIQQKKIEKAAVQRAAKEQERALRAAQKEQEKVRRAVQKAMEKAAEKERRESPEERRRSQRSTFLSFCLNDYYRFSESLFENYLSWKESYCGNASNRYEKIKDFFSDQQEAQPIVPILVKNMVGEILPLELQYNPLKMSFDLAKQLAEIDPEAYPLYECQVFRILEEGPVEEGEIFGLIVLAPNLFRASPVYYPLNQGYGIHICLKREGVKPMFIYFRLDQTIGYYYDQPCSVEEIAAMRFSGEKINKETNRAEFYSFYLNEEQRNDFITLINFVKRFYV